MSLSLALRGCLISLVFMLQACGGGGGGGATNSSSSSGSVTAKAVQGSSLESKAVEEMPAALTQLPKLPNLNALLGTFTEIGTLTSMGTSLAVADFQRNGTFSAFVIASDQTSTAKAFFVGYNSSTGAWINLSDTLFHQASDRVACVSPQQAAVADLNQDGRPDVYVACAGIGAGPVAQNLYLSRSDGTYEKAPGSTWPSSLHASSVALADITNDGCTDVVTTNAGNLVIYIATCSGTSYTLADESTSRSPCRSLLIPSCSSSPVLLPSSILSVFLVPNPDTPTRYDLLVAADPSGQSQPIMWFANSGGGSFFNTAYRAYSIQWGNSSNRYDYVVSGAYGYIYITNSSNQTFVKLAKIVVPRATSNLSPVYYTPPNTNTPINDWPAYLRVRNNNLEPYDASCGTTVQADDTSRCGKRYPLSGFPAL